MSPQSALEGALWVRGEDLKTELGSHRRSRLGVNDGLPSTHHVPVDRPSALHACDLKHSLLPPPRSGENIGIKDTRCGAGVTVKKLHKVTQATEEQIHLYQSKARLITSQEIGPKLC